MIPIWILGGFLGAGKTSALGNLVPLFAPERIGAVVNDFGEIGVDAIRVQKDTAGANPIVAELNGGQIFCSCISGSFVNSLVEMGRQPVAAIIVEASGMAKPNAMGPIIREAVNRGDGAIGYAGTITIIDTPRFARLRSVVNAVDEQVVYADAVVLNKCDLASARAIADVRAAIAALNPAAPQHETTFGTIDRAWLPNRTADSFVADGDDNGSSYRGWGGAKPRCTTWTPKETLSTDALRNAVERRISEGALRIKGYAQSTDGTVYVDAVGATVTIERVPDDVRTDSHGAPTATGLVVFEEEKRK